MNRLDTHRVVSIDDIERRIRERPPLREPVHVRIGSPFDDLRDLWAEICASPGSHILVGFAGLATGCFGTVGLAQVIAWVAF